MPSFKTSRVRLRARTPPFHGGDTGSNPVRGTKASQKCEAFYFEEAALPKPVNIKLYLLMLLFQKVKIFNEGYKKWDE